MRLPRFFFGGKNLNSLKVLFMEEFTMEVLNVVAIIVAGLMVGSELAWLWRRHGNGLSVEVR